MAEPSKRLENARWLLSTFREHGHRNPEQSNLVRNLHWLMTQRANECGLKWDEASLLKVIAEEEAELKREVARERAEDEHRAKVAHERELQHLEQEQRRDSLARERAEDERRRQEWELRLREKELELKLREAHLRKLEAESRGFTLGPETDTEDFDADDL